MAQHLFLCLIWLVEYQGLFAELASSLASSLAYAQAEAADLHRRREERALHRPGAPFSRSAHHVAGGRGERQLELGEQPELKRFELKRFECRLGRLHGCQLLEQHGLAVRLLEHAAMHFPDEIDTGHETVRGEEAFLIMLKRHAVWP